jgi:hypothetical protein
VGQPAIGFWTALADIVVIRLRSFWLWSRYDFQTTARIKQADPGTDPTGKSCHNVSLPGPPERLLLDDTRKVSNNRLSMLLSSIRIVGLGPFEDLAFRFHDSESNPRRVVVVLGGGGVGKTTVLSAISSTRPGYAVAQTRPRGHDSPHARFVVADWAMGDDDPARPHPLRVVSPNVVIDEPDDVSLLRRREQALFDKRAADGGFVQVAFSSARWFSRSPVVLTAPERTLLRYDVKASASFDDATRADLARETKQTLSYADTAAALASSGRPTGKRASGTDPQALAQAMREVVGRLTSLAGFQYIGADPVSLEPMFENDRGGAIEFDELPTSVRHLAALGALSLRALRAGWPARDPAQAEGVVLVDDLDLHQDARTLPEIVPALREALPRVQWIVTASSPAVAHLCDPSEVVALRRMPSSPRIELYEGALATVH